MTPVEEPVIIAYGRSLVHTYPADEYKACLRRAFVEGRADFITLDSNPRGQRFTAACAAWAIDQGWLVCDRVDSDEQSEVASFRLTPEGHEALK